MITCNPSASSPPVNQANEPYQSDLLGVHLSSSLSALSPSIPEIEQANPALPWLSNLDNDWNNGRLSTTQDDFSPEAYYNFPIDLDSPFLDVDLCPKDGQEQHIISFLDELLADTYESADLSEDSCCNTWKSKSTSSVPEFCNVQSLLDSTSNFYRLTDLNDRISPLSSPPAADPIKLSDDLGIYSLKEMCFAEDCCSKGVMEEENNYISNLTDIMASYMMNRIADALLEYKMCYNCFEPNIARTSELFEQFIGWSDIFGDNLDKNSLAQYQPVQNVSMAAEDGGLQL